jgi:hypothetical protein
LSVIDPIAAGRVLVGKAQLSRAPLPAVGELERALLVASSKRKIFSNKRGLPRLRAMAGHGRRGWQEWCQCERFPRLGQPGAA